MYFTFTTLTTVGFGDLYPKNDLERSVGAFFLLAGVATFSYIIGDLLASIDQVLKLEGEENIHADLEKFFNLLTYFNGGTNFNRSLQNEFCEHLENIQTNDRNSFLQEEEH